MKRRKVFATLVVLGIIGLIAGAIVIAQQQITLTTYYPAPYGEYQTLLAKGINTGFLEVEGDADVNILDFLVGQRDWSVDPPPIVQAAQAEFVGDVVIGRGGESSGLTLNGKTITSWDQVAGNEPLPVVFRHSVLPHGGKISLPDGGGGGYAPPDTSFWLINGAPVPLLQSECVWFVSPHEQSIDDTVGKEFLTCFTDAISDRDDLDGVGRFVQCFSKNKGAATYVDGEANAFIICTYGQTGQWEGASACPNGSCEAGETCQTCPADCPPDPSQCGNNACQSAAPYCEKFANCAADCEPPIGTCVFEKTLVDVEGLSPTEARKVKLGQRVLGYDFKQKKAVYGKVRAYWEEEMDTLYVVTTERGTVRYSWSHQLWTQRGWIPAQDLLLTDQVHYLEGDTLVPVPIQKLETEKGQFVVVNYDVEGIKTYFAEGMLTHNMKPKPLK